MSRTIFALPNEFGKGILTPTAHGNLFLTDSDRYRRKEGTNTTREGLDQVLTKSRTECKRYTDASGNYFICRTSCT